MGLRVSLAALLAIPLLFIGVIAMSESAQQVEPTLNSTSANTSYSVAEQVFNGVSTAGIGIVWFGIAAVVVVALGFVVFAGQSGGR